MVTAERVVSVTDGSELGRILDEAVESDLVFERNGVRFRIVPEPSEIERLERHSDPFASYDPERVRQAFDRAAGTLKGLDVDAFLAEIRESRDQDSTGRPGW